MNQNHVVQSTGSNFTDYDLTHHIFLGIQDKILPEFQIYLITCVVYKTTLKLDARGRFVHVHTMKAYKGSRNINPLIHNLVIRWRALVSLKFWPLNSHRKSPLYELNRRLGESHNQSGCLREEKNFLLCQETKL